MSSPIEVRVHERGSARESNLSEDAGMQARCELCSAVTDAVVSVGAAWSLRATSVAVAPWNRWTPPPCSPAPLSVIVLLRMVRVAS